MNVIFGDSAIQAYQVKRLSRDQHSAFKELIRIMSHISLKLSIEKMLLFLSVISMMSATSQDSLIVPKGIVYKKTETIVNQSAINILKLELSSELSYKIFDSVFIIGPRLWNEYQNVPDISRIKNGNIQLNITIEKNKKQLVPAKMIQTSADYQTVWFQFKKDIGPLFRIRNLNAEELLYYWTVIFYDIEEPIFVIENNKSKFLVDLSRENKIVWIDKL